MHAINLDEKFSRFAEHWRPKCIAAVNGQELKLVKVQGTFPWHRHEREDELFLVWKGHFRLEFRDRVVHLSAGELIAVPHGVEHRTAADEEAEILLFEPSGVRNTGDTEHDLYTAPPGETI